MKYDRKSPVFQGKRGRIELFDNWHYKKDKAWINVADNIANADLFKGAQIDRSASDYGRGYQNGDERSCEETCVPAAAPPDEVDETQAGALSGC